MQDLPQLPEMKPMAAAVPPPSASAMPAAPAKSEAVVGTRRLRQLVSAIGGAGLALVLLILFFEAVARPELRPTALAAAIEGRIERGIMNIKLGHEPGEMVITEAQYREALANAERKGAAAAELVFQRELADIQADKELLVGAYQALYQRTNIIAQAAVAMEQVALQFRQQLVVMSNNGRVAVISVKDMICGVGFAGACEAARADRAEMLREADALTRTDVADRVRQLLSEVDDPATLIARTRGREKTE